MVLKLFAQKSKLSGNKILKYYFVSIGIEIPKPFSFDTVTKKTRTCLREPFSILFRDVLLGVSIIDLFVMSLFFHNAQ